MTRTEAGGHRAGGPGGLANTSSIGGGKRSVGRAGGASAEASKHRIRSTRTEGIILL